MKYLFYGIASWLLMPVALFEGIKLRARTQRLHPPDGQSHGIVGDDREPDYRILVLGDSSAAGVGADRLEDTIGPQIAAVLHERTGATVAWHRAGSNSAICEQLRDLVVPNLERHDYTHVIIAAGTNDAKNFLTARRFKRGFGGLLYAVKAKWPEATIIWSPVIDMRTVPALPPLLAQILEMRVRIINRVGRQLCPERFAIAAPRLQPPDSSGFSSDGFHAGASGYRYWAELLAQTVIEQREPAGEPHPGQAKAAE
ncbi:SGNH/GDSL hydrolase family protein [Hoeflea poritis]|uniref:SGNH/GDSL hydrolase family protein n=1 Tax=Hoeflea poritis TaxID=2993659 RepID=A0ABT4VQU7_9HYPH|nr:SGNH/GDSL hydrolase family protein [Hoeflea poritis]MDA4847083.1 SGNH/GDSL hydrolase family protein [Hoeflea poritis]